MNTAPLTIGELVSIDTLRTRVIAGSTGLDRRVLWAHSCELDEPWRWLGADELLMTVGFCVPKAPEAQVEFVRELNRAGIVGAMIGHRDLGLSLSPEMLAEADRLGFPLMHTDEEVPWSAIARHVAAASSSNQTSQVMTLAKLYELTATSADAAELARGIAALLRIEISVREDETGIEIIRTSSEPDALRDSERVESSLRVRAHPLMSRFPATLEIGEYPGAGLGAMLLVHVKRILEVETDRLVMDLDARAEAHEAQLGQLLRGRESREIAELFATAAVRGGFRLIAHALLETRRVARAVLADEYLAVTGGSASAGLLLVPSTELWRVRKLLGSLDVVAGVSSTFDELGDLRGYVSEAESALLDAQSSRQPWVEFEGTRIAVFSRSEREAGEIIRSVLGPLAERTERAAVLRDTLFTYLRHERSWAGASAELDIHRQTLSYRLRQVEKLTGRSIARTEDLAALWIASQAWQKFGTDEVTTDPE